MGYSGDTRSLDCSSYDAGFRRELYNLGLRAWGLGV